MPESGSFPSFYDPSSVRAIVTPSAFARQNLFFLQEAGHIRLLESHAGTQRSSLDSFLIVQVAAGSGRLQYDGKTWPLQAGQCFWVDCRRPHGYRSADDDPWELRWVHFNGHSAPAFYGLFAAGPGRCSPPPTLGPLPDAWTRCWTWPGTGTPPPSWKPPPRSRRCWRGSWRTGPTAGSSPPPAARLEEVRAYVIAHCAENFSLDELAARFYLSKYYLARSFRQRYGETIVDCRLSARIDMAKQMLRYTDLTLGQIAARCGFKEQAYFTRRFRAAEGQTATEYRRAWRGRG